MFRRWVFQNSEFALWTSFAVRWRSKSDVWQSHEIIGKYKTWVYSYIAWNAVFNARKSSSLRNLYFGTLQQFAKSEGQIILITATTVVVVSLFQNGFKIHSLLCFVVWDNKSTNATASSSFKYGLHSDQTQLCKVSLIIVYEASLMRRRLSKIVDVVLKDHCHSRNSSKQMFVGLCIVFSGEYPQLLSVLPSC